MATAAKSPKPKPKTSRSRKPAAPPRMKIVLAIYNQHLRRVATFNFDQQVEAEAKLADLNKDGGTSHFLQRLKEPVEETAQA